MMIEVLGTGCAKCDKLEAMARAAAEKLALPCEITHVRDVDVIVQRGVMTTPALAIDGRVVVSGRIPSEAELASWLTSTCVDR
jgi:small redox-active disulfide protein 2